MITTATPQKSEVEETPADVRSMTPDEVRIRALLELTMQQRDHEADALLEEIRILTEGVYGQDEAKLSRHLDRLRGMYTRIGWLQMALEAFDAGHYWAAKRFISSSEDRLLTRMQEDPAAEEFESWQRMVAIYRRFIEAMESLESSRTTAG